MFITREYFYENGKIRTQTIRDDLNRDIIYIGWTTNGKLKYFSAFKMGLQDGFRIQCDLNGKFEYTTYHIKGMQEGEAINYFK